MTKYLGIDYMITRSCPAKETLGDYFLVLVKKRARISYLEQFKKNNPSFNEHTVFEEIEETSLGISRRLTSMSLMREELTPLTEWQQDCEECGANFTYHPGGCWFYLPYPIPEMIEKLLIVVVQGLVEDDKNHKAAEFIQELPQVNPELGIINGWRNNGLTELKIPLSFNWGMFFRKRTITTDQVLDTIFNRNLVEGEQLSRLTVFLEYFQRCTTAGLQKATVDNQNIAEMSEFMRNNLQPYWQFIKACQIADELAEGIFIIP